MDKAKTKDLDQEFELKSANLILKNTNNKTLPNYADFLTRKRLGDELQAEACLKYNKEDESNKYVVVTIDRMLFVHCMLIGCPCILDLGRGKSFKIYNPPEENQIGGQTSEENENIIEFEDPPHEDTRRSSRIRGQKDNQDMTDGEMNEFIKKDPKSIVLALKLLMPNKNPSRARTYFENLNLANFVEIPLAFEGRFGFYNDDKIPEYGIVYNDDINLVENSINFHDRCKANYYIPILLDTSANKCLCNTGRPGLIDSDRALYIRNEYKNGKQKDRYDIDITIDKLYEQLKNNKKLKRYSDYDKEISNAYQSQSNVVTNIMMSIFAILLLYFIFFCSECHSVSDDEFQRVNFFPSRNNMGMISDQFECRAFYTRLIQIIRYMMSGQSQMGGNGTQKRKRNNSTENSKMFMIFQSFNFGYLLHILKNLESKTAYEIYFDTVGMIEYVIHSSDYLDYDNIFFKDYSKDVTNPVYIRTKKLVVEIVQHVDNVLLSTEYKQFMEHIYEDNTVPEVQNFAKIYNLEFSGLMSLYQQLPIQEEEVIDMMASFQQTIAQPTKKGKDNFIRNPILDEMSDAPLAVMGGKQTKKKKGSKKKVAKRNRYKKKRGHTRNKRKSTLNRKRGHK
jgi:hypothetical protein